MVTRPDTAELRRLAEAATPGPWERDPVDNPGWQIIAAGNEVVVNHGRHQRQNDAQVVANHNFIAAARNNMLPLLDALDAAEAKLAKLREMAAQLEAALRDLVAAGDAVAQVTSNRQDWRKFTTLQDAARALLQPAACATCGGSGKVREYVETSEDEYAVDNPCPDCAKGGSDA